MKRRQRMLTPKRQPATPANDILVLQMSIKTLEARAAAGEPVTLSPELARSVAVHLRRSLMGVVGNDEPAPVAGAAQG